MKQDLQQWARPRSVWRPHNGRALIFPTLLTDKMVTPLQANEQPITPTNIPGTNNRPKLPMRPDAAGSEDLNNGGDVIQTYTSRDVLNGRGQGVQRHPGMSNIVRWCLSTRWVNLGGIFALFYFRYMCTVAVCEKRFIFTITSGHTILLGAHHVYFMIVVPRLSQPFCTILYPQFSMVSK